MYQKSCKKFPKHVCQPLIFLFFNNYEIVCFMDKKSFLGLFCSLKHIKLKNRCVCF